MTGDKSRAAVSLLESGEQSYNYVQATINITISNHPCSRDGGYRERTWVIADDADSSHKTDSRGGRSSSTTYTTVTSTTTGHNYQQQHQKQQQGVQWSGGWGITTQANVNPSSVTTERFLQPCRLDPSCLRVSHHRHIQLQRHCGVSSGTRLGSETRILPVLHTRWTDKQHSDPSCCRLAIRVLHVQAARWVSTANTSRPIRDSPRDLAHPPPPPPSWPVGLVEAENNTCTVAFNSDIEAERKL